MPSYLKNNVSFIFAGLVSVAALTAVAASTVFFKGQSPAELAITRDEQGHFAIRSREPSYTVIRKYVGDGNVTLSLLETVLTRNYVTHLDGETGEVSLRMRVGNQLKTIAWEKKDAATSSNYEEEIDAVVTTLGGCCGAMDSHRAYDAQTGKLLLSYSEGIPYNRRYNLPYILEIPNSRLAPRLIGVITPDATRDADFVTPTNGMEAAALVKYTSRDGGFHKLQVDVKTQSNYGISVVSELVLAYQGEHAPEIREGRATLWNADKATDASLIGGVALKLTVSAGLGDLTILIPVRADRLDLDGAVVPAGAVLRAL